MNVKDFLGNADEKPLDRLVSDGGFCGILRTIGCIGDSLSSGEFEGTDDDGNKTFHDFYDYSWGQYLARMAGCKAYNFSMGGMSAKAYCESFAEERGFWNPELACTAYIIALGVNDLFNQKQEVGEVKDIDLENYENNTGTFIKYYAQIVQRMKKIQPDAKFFFVTMPKAENDERAELKRIHAERLWELTEIFSNSYVIDLNKYAPVYDEEFRKNFYLGTHMNACGYMFTAQLMASYIDYIIRHNMQDFKQVGFIGTEFENRKDGHK